ncbi:MAG TPA: SIMPL domain-containing protein [Gaiellaceae bacterium]|nr:SIMPL domain-containing protein [Gaiellaceae bacterium]
MKLVRIAALALLVLAVAALAGVGRPEGARSAAADGTGDGVTVTGTGSVRTVPDRAAFAFGVETQAATARAALTANSAAMEKVIAAVRGAGVAAADLQTSQVSIFPRTDERGTGIVGYTATNSVSATIRELGRVGAVVDAAVEAGANTVSGPSLTRGDTDALYRQALRAAFADARAKAEALATASGRTLGAVTAMVESGSATPSPVPMRDSVTGSVPIEPGTQSVEASVAVTFALV